MYSVTARVKSIKQPRGGYINPTMFTKTLLEDGENITALDDCYYMGIVGTVVDYMTRYLMTGDKEGAFSISIEGYDKRIESLGKSQMRKDRRDGVDKQILLDFIEGLDDESISSACQLASYDVWVRAPWSMSVLSNPWKPDTETIKDIRTMIRRSVRFWEMYGPITSDGFSFCECDNEGKIVHNGYSKIVISGDGDYLTKDTLWDFKVLKSAPTSKHTLQVLMYWIMGKHSGMDIFSNINRIGIFNPRLNIVYELDMDKVPEETILEVEKNVICY